MAIIVNGLPGSEPEAAPSEPQLQEPATVDPNVPELTQPTEPTVPPTSPADTLEDNVTYKGSYTVSNEDAKANAERNGVSNAEFFCGDAGQAALELEKQGVKADVVIVDPPRKGLNADTIEALARFAPRRIVYVSCDPATLARDVALLKEKGFVLKNAQAFDLFPRCAHVESVVTMVKVDAHA